MNVLILGINYAPEQVGIGPYTAGMAGALAAAGHAVTVVCAKPYYPQWRVDPAFAGGGARVSVEDGVRVVRLPLYVPAEPGGRRRLLHHASFAWRAQAAMFAEAARRKPDVVVGIAPSLISIIAARTTARVVGARLWLHVQDFEVEAAFATGLLGPAPLLALAARGFERWAMRADRVSAISPRMCARLIAGGVPREKVVEFRNWADVEPRAPLAAPSSYRALWRIDRPHVAIYSGNIANKQGIEVIVEAARRLRHRRDLMFVVCGDGPGRQRMIESAAGLDNIQFHGLQPREALPELLGLASIHLLPQIAGTADLMLPSKLSNMLASGRPVAATALAGTSLADEVEGCGLVSPPEDGERLAAAIARLLDDEALRRRLGDEARRRARERWSRTGILARFEQQLCEVAA